MGGGRQRSQVTGTRKNVLREVAFRWTRPCGQLGNSDCGITPVALVTGTHKGSIPVQGIS